MPRLPSPRRCWLLLHRWLALALGVPLLVVALLGAALVVLKPLDRALNAALFAVPPGPAAPDLLETTRARLRAEFGRDAALTFRPPRADGESLKVIVRGPWDGFVHVDPRDARELGRRGEREGLFNFVFELHSSLLMNDAGKPLLAILALAYGVLLIGGLWLWWPRRWNRAALAQSFALTLDRSRLRAVFDLHRTGGAVLGLLIAVPVATGAYMAWKPLAQGVSAAAGATPRLPPKVPATAAAAAAVALDAIVATAQARFPGAPVGYVQVPAAATKPVRVRLILADDPHPNGLTSVWLHPVGGAVLGVDHWNELDPGARGYGVIYPLHTGELGGPLLEAFNALLGAALAALAAFGLWLWWARRR